MTRPQTLRQAAASYRRRSSRPAALPHAELRRLERANELQQRADKLREAERKKKINREKREKQLEQEREKRRREQTGGLRFEREVKTGGVKASQEVLGKFWSGAEKRNHGDAGDRQERQERQRGQRVRQNDKRDALRERSANLVTPVKPRRAHTLPQLSQHHLLPQSPSQPAKRRKLSSPISTSTSCCPAQPSSTTGCVKRKRNCVPSSKGMPTPSTDPHIIDTIDSRDEEWISLLPSNTQIDREIVTTSSPPPAPRQFAARSTHQEPSYLSDRVASDQDIQPPSTPPKSKEDIDPFHNATHIAKPATTAEQPLISTQDLLFSSADLSELLRTSPPISPAHTLPPPPSPPSLNNPLPAQHKIHIPKQSDDKSTQQHNHKDINHPKAEPRQHTGDSSRILASLSFSTLYSDDGPALSEEELSLLLDKAVTQWPGVKIEVSSGVQNT